MRSMRVLRKSRKARVAAGALMLTVPSSAVALAVGQADAQSEVQIDVSSGHVGYGHHVTVNGTVPSGTPGAGGRARVRARRRDALADRRLDQAPWRWSLPIRPGASPERAAPGRCPGRRPNVARDEPERGILGRAELPTAGFGGFEVRAPAPVDGGPRRSGRQRARDAPRARPRSQGAARRTPARRLARGGVGAHRFARRVSDPLSPR